MLKEVSRCKVWIFAGAIALAFSGATGCSKEKKADESAVPTAAGADETFAGSSDAGTAGGIQSVHYDYDAYDLTAEAKGILKANAQILKDHASVKLEIEGHCDERGGIQYNLALGEKRANAAKKYLVDAGVAADRLGTVSYGKERPLDPASNEAAWAKNRRANFVVTSK